MDSIPVEVMGVSGIDYWRDGREIFDNIHLVYSYSSGVKAKFTCLTSNSKDDYQIKILGDKGTIMLDYTSAWLFPEDHEREFDSGDGVSGATIQRDRNKGIPLDVEHAEPS